ncbi:hypothetical protein EV186_106196 [Labedaea rhizosphaerae]|uniref:Uncharacterized protein n=1 Tax=Labedaea rhizosphaerae TaxID=598644 RepID=A0A4R6S2K4_LABRH|nr:hypothetical protein EV186_106196 [Labedaea rhizosphaerae]
MKRLAVAVVATWLLTRAMRTRLGREARRRRRCNPTLTPG